MSDLCKIAARSFTTRMNHEANTTDAHRPQEIAELIETAGVAKAALPAFQMFVLAILAGVFIGFGAAAYTMTVTGLDLSYGPYRLLGGVVFSLGLILVMAAVDRKIGTGQLLRNWTIVFAGNLVGAVGLALTFGLSGLLDGSMGTTAAFIIDAKMALTPLEAFVRGALCNALVCLAVWLTFAARTVAGKILGIIWPISGFVLLGLEHSIANLYFFPQGWAATSHIDMVPAITNLFWVTLGNIVGGAGGVALANHFAFKGGRTG